MTQESKVAERAPLPKRGDRIQFAAGGQIFKVLDANEDTRSLRLILISADEDGDPPKIISVAAPQKSVAAPQKPLDGPGLHKPTKPRGIAADSSGR